ncbi:thiamine phosphate synthase [Lewinella sp. JB7]|uniref:thiamine phosphate synthase n=1 Tax=Lewinella sp. JB7 TaxID=2962887 RepID=UPI0020C978E3|nr:thiamine phosphate synthase [Lewinella sp. JB7]MCP9236485.1 thiamine phosphate synthase [Lewinella sp. JB7]
MDPKRNRPRLLQQLEQALRGGLGLVQVWNHWTEGVPRMEKLNFLGEVKAICTSFGVPVLMHEDWELAHEADLQGVHFDVIPGDFVHIREVLSGSIIGVTVSNDRETIKKAEELGVDYFSFCAIFPSPSAVNCEIVQPANIRAARAITDMSIFLSGGIHPDNLFRLSGLDFDGVAVISGILDVADPAEAVKAYRAALHKLKP